MRKHLTRHNKKVHSASNPRPTSTDTVGRPRARNTAVSDDALHNEVLQSRIARKMDATKDYAHTYREQGRFGSHPSHDDYDDEGRP